MILFLDEDRAYLNWVAHHRRGYVLDCLRHPTQTRLMLHRASCAEIKRSASKRTYWTTGRRMKGCSLDLEELAAWARDQAKADPAYCPQCTPHEEPRTEAEPHLTKLDRDILDYTLEIATCFLDCDDHPYTLSVGMVARCLGKTEGQLSAAFERLVLDGLLVITGNPSKGSPPSPNARVFPTGQALRTLPVYAKMSDRKIKSELKKIHGDD